MTPLYDSCHIATHKNQKRYDSQRVIEIFKLCRSPSHSAFATALPKLICTTSEILSATEAHERAEAMIAADIKQHEQRYNRQIELETVAKILSNSNRFLIKNTNNSKCYLLDAGFKPSAMYCNARGIQSLKIDPTVKHRIASECNIGIDQFCFEAITKWNVHSIIDQYEEIESA